MEQVLNYEQLRKLIDLDRKEKHDKYNARMFYYYKPDSDDEEEIVTVLDQNSNLFNTKKTKSNRIYVNYLKQLVTQKIDYLLAAPVTADEKLESIQIDVNDLLDNVMLNASLDSCAWTHLYIDNEGKLEWILVPDAEIIPMYDDHKKDILQLIRYYPIPEKKIKVELWTPTDVTFYILDDTTKCMTEEVDCHYKVASTYQGQVEEVQPMAFGYIPFIPCFNNKDHQSDSEDIECLLRTYNDVCSGFVNDIRKFQEAILKLTNYTGTQEGLVELLVNIKKNGIVGMPEGGDLEQMATDIPTEARTTLLTILKDLIYTIGRGMDSNKLNEGASQGITNVNIAAKYQQLDFKASDCEKRLQVFYKQFIDRVNKFYRLNIKPDLKLNRKMLINAAENIENCVAAMAFLSKETILEQCVWCSDTKTELDRIANETAQIAPKDKPVV